MATGTIDPRITRTRKLIMDSIGKLIEKKSFTSITIKDITAEATVNRATFYHHFSDKYDLLDKLIREEIAANVLQEMANKEELNEDMIKSVFLSITQMLTGLSGRCQRDFQDISLNIEAIIKKELENVFFQLLVKKYPHENDEKLRIDSTILSWMIYGATVDWQHHSKKPLEEYYQFMILSIKQLLTNEIDSKKIQIS